MNKVIHCLFFAVLTTVGCVDGFSIEAWAAPCLAGEVGGRVFRDFDSNGTVSAFESNWAISPITVSAYSSSGALITSTAVGSDGNYSLGVISSVAQGVRLELSGLPTYIEPGAVGTDSRSSVRFISSLGCTYDFGVQNPAQYCQTNPNVAISCTQSGSLVGNSAAALVHFPFSSTGIPLMFGGSAANPSMDADLQNLGTTWAVAFQRATKRLFVGTFLRRHTGLGTAGIGGVYVMDYSGPTAALAGSFSLQGVSPSNGGAAIDLGSVTRNNIVAGVPGDFDLPSNPATANIDLDAYAKVGTTSFGDVALTEDGNTLWLVNLNQRALVSFDVSGATASLPGPVIQTPLSSLAGVPTCTNGIFRPWAIEFHDGRGYLGGVCSAESGGTSADLVAYILSFDQDNVGTGFTTEISFPLNYVRENIDNGQAPPISAAWRPWNNNYAALGITVAFPGYAQPILSGIKFTENGSMVLGFSDRFSLQLGYSQKQPVSGGGAFNVNVISGGDTLFVCRSGSSWIMEGQSGCADHDTASRSMVDGPSNVGEYFYQDAYYTTGGSVPAALHDEISQGGVGFVPNTGLVMATVLDPNVNTAFGVGTFTGGLQWYDYTAGTLSRGFMVVPRPSSFPGYFGKASSLGEPEALCLPAPIEIGNRLWADTDLDGVQDPDEAPLSGVTIILRDLNGTQLATAVTDSNGNYLFSSSTTGSSTSSSIYGIAGLTAQTSGFSACVPLSQAALTGYVSTQANADASLNGSSRDSNGLVVSGESCATFSTGKAGANNHTIDFGFYQLASIGDYVWLDTNRDGIQDPSESGIGGVTLRLFNCSDTLVSTSTSASDGSYHFTGLIPGCYYVRCDRPSGYGRTSANSGADDARDSDSDISTGNMAQTTLQPGEDDPTWDCGFYLDTCGTALDPEKTAIDSHLFNLRQVARSALSLRKQAGDNGACSAIRASTFTSKRAQINSIFDSGWQIIWSVLAASQDSGCSGGGISCVDSNFSADLSSISSKASQLRALARSWLNASCLQSTTATARKASRLLSNLSSYYKAYLTSIKAYPTTVTQCS